MSLSAEQVNHYHDKWWNLINPILSELFTGSDNAYLNAQIGSTFWAVMCDLRFSIMIEEFLDGYDIFIQDEWSVELPKLLIEESKYGGDVIIDLAGARTAVCLEHFCFVTKVAAIFYAKYIEPDFEAWKHFVKIDQLYEEFGVVKQV